MGWNEYYNQRRERYEKSLNDANKKPYYKKDGGKNDKKDIKEM